jgi:hypothetical protein
MIPLILAFIIYGLFRETAFNTPLLEEYVKHLSKSKTGSFIIFNLPDLFWVWSYLLFIDRINPNESRKKFFWTLFVPFIGTSLEIAQAKGWLYGTYDPIDLLIFSTFPVIYYLIKKAL